MTTQPAAQTGYTGAWRWGLLFGILQPALYYGVRLMLGYLVPGMSELVSSLVDIVLFGLGLLLCGCAGYIAASKSGSPYTGNSAGLYAGLVSASIGIAIVLLLSFTTSGPIQQLVRQIPLLMVISVGCYLGIYGILGLVAGVIGGELAQRGMARTG